jgi:hypothetical protein
VKKTFLLFLFWSSGLSSLCHGYGLASDLPAPRMGCPDILFKTFNAPSDASLTGILKLAYEYCIFLEGLKEKAKGASLSEKKRIAYDMKVINDLLKPIFSSYSVGDFMFANTNLNQILSQEKEKKSENEVVNN